MFIEGRRIISRVKERASRCVRHGACVTVRESRVKERASRCVRVVLKSVRQGACESC